MAVLPPRPHLVLDALDALDAPPEPAVCEAGPASNSRALRRRIMHGCRPPTPSSTRGPSTAAGDTQPVEPWLGRRTWSGPQGATREHRPRVDVGKVPELEVEMAVPRHDVELRAAADEAGVHRGGRYQCFVEGSLVAVPSRHALEEGDRFRRRLDSVDTEGEPCRSGPPVRGRGPGSSTGPAPSLGDMTTDPARKGRPGLVRCILLGVDRPACDAPRFDV